MADTCSILTSMNRTLRSSTLLKRKSLEVADYSHGKKQKFCRNEKKDAILTANEQVSSNQLLLECCLVKDVAKVRPHHHVETNHIATPLHPPIANHIKQLSNDTIPQCIPTTNYVEICNGESDLLEKLWLDENLTFLNQNAKDSDKSMPVDTFLAVSALNVRIQAKHNSLCENVLTYLDVFKPQKASEFVGNALIVKQLCDWLREWEQKFRKESGNSLKYDSDFLYSSDSNESLLNCILLFGPSGVGKTSLVYALAQQMGFTVLEINPSSLRSGRVITTQLREATLSHHVEGSSCMTNHVQVNTSMRNIENKKKSSKNNKSGPVKQQPEHRPKKISDFFKMTIPLANDDDVTVVTETKIVPKLKKVKSSLLNYFSPVDVKKELQNDILCELPLKISDSDSLVRNSKDEHSHLALKNYGEAKSLSFSSNTIILIDDVDVVFEEDEGFWSTVNSFIRTTKKPVILTASRNLQEILSNVHSDIDLHLMGYPDCSTIAVAIQKMLGTMSLEVELDALKKLADFCGRDIRHTLLQLQFYMSVKSEEPNLGLIKHLKESSIYDACLVVESLRSTPNFVLCDNFSEMVSLPFGETVPVFSTEPKKKVLDLSWLSDEGEPLKQAEDNEEPELGSHIKESLCYVAEHLENFSVADTFDKCFSDQEKKRRWNIGLPSLDEYVESAGNMKTCEMVSWINVLSLRVTDCKLASLVTDNPLDSKLCWTRLTKLDLDGLNHSYDAITSTIVPFCRLNQSALRQDYSSSLRAIFKAETLRKGSNSKRRGRFLHYFDSIGLNIDMNAVGELVAQSYT